MDCWQRRHEFEQVRGVRFPGLSRFSGDGIRVSFCWTPVRFRLPKTLESESHCNASNNCSGSASITRGPRRSRFLGSRLPVDFLPQHLVGPCRELRSASNSCTRAMSVSFNRSCWAEQHVLFIQDFPDRFRHFLTEVAGGIPDRLGGGFLAGGVPGSGLGGAPAGDFGLGRLRLPR